MRLPFGIAKKFGLPGNGDAMKPLMPLEAIIVKKNYGLEAQGWLIEQLAGDGGSGITGTHNRRG
jgi:hypothetical protein